MYMKKNNHLDFFQVYFWLIHITCFDIHHLSPSGSTYIFTSFSFVPPILLLQGYGHTQPWHFPNMLDMF